MMVTQGQRIGLLGANGAGKSTFLRCVAGIEGVDDGTVEIGSGSKLLYVDQEPEWKVCPACAHARAASGMVE